MDILKQKIHVTVKGPYLIRGNLSLVMDDGTEIKKEGVTALCRCGASSNKPFCDGTHSRIKFKG